MKVPQRFEIYMENITETSGLELIPQLLARSIVLEGWRAGGMEEDRETKEVNEGMKEVFTMVNRYDVRSIILSSSNCSP